jgi:hypothetical protein
MAIIFNMANGRRASAGSRASHLCEFCLVRFPATGVAFVIRPVGRPEMPPIVTVCLRCARRMHEVLKPARPPEHLVNTWQGNGEVSQATLLRCSFCLERFAYHELTPVAYGPGNWPRAALAMCPHCLDRRTADVRPLNMVKARAMCCDLALLSRKAFPKRRRCALCCEELASSMLAPSFCTLGVHRALIATCSRCRRRHGRWLTPPKPGTQDYALRELRLPEPTRSSRNNGRALPRRITSVVQGGAPGLGKRA